ncbi:SET domain-containing 4 isoform X1 [Brachionus plicatilis]|uniref:SET domain-containing 4 isoform X1 n=1 Tax=Brachionus plicatilis TaxID=10195 RepID=A0A3M7R625_BRAPC|nr:SET domain-containing 4 isoform X1 [Brachionus plicatilis]
MGIWNISSGILSCPAALFDLRLLMVQHNRTREYGNSSQNSRTRIVLIIGTLARVDAIVRDLCAWLEENNVDLGAEKNLFLVQSENNCEGRCVISQKDYEPNSTILEFPLKFQINYRNAFKSDSLVKFLDWYAKKHPPIGQNLKLNRLDALYLFMIEQKFAKNSFLSKFINSLPHTYDTPEYFDKSLIDSLPDCFKRIILKRSQKLDLKFNFISNLLHECKKESQCKDIEDLCTNFTRDNFRWIFCSVNSRCFHAKESEICDKNEICQANKYFGKIKESDGEMQRAMKCSSLAEYERCLERSEEVRNNLCCLIPYLDFLNHSNEPNAFAFFDKDTQVFSLKSQASENLDCLAIRKGDQVYITYGPHDNLTLLIEYGFIINNNVYDKLSFSFDTLKELIRVDDSTEQFIWNCCIQKNLLYDLTCDQSEGPSWSLLKFLDFISCFDQTKNQSKKAKISTHDYNFYDINNFKDCKILFLKLLENIGGDLDRSLQKLEDLDDKVKKSYHFKMSRDLIKSYKLIVEFNTSLANDQERWAMMF